MKTQNHNLNPVRFHRLLAGRTQIELALQIGCSQTQIHAIERGYKVPSRDQLRKIAKVLECSVADLEG